MRSLVLTDTVYDIRVRAGKLIVNRYHAEGHEAEEYNPRSIDFENIVIASTEGNITTSAIAWLSRNNVPVVFLDWKGEIVSTLESPSMEGIKRLKQYEAYTKNRIEIAREIIAGKLEHTRDFLLWLKERYDIDIERFQFDQMLSQLKVAKSIKSIMGIEGIVANTYWSEVSKVFEDTKFPMGNRDIGKTHRPMNAIDEVNTLLNYGYGYLKSIIQKTLIMNGLDPSIGFLHEAVAGARPLTYDFIEPYRFIVDWSVVRGVESNTITKKDFARDALTYSLRLKKSGVEKLLRLIQESLSTRVRYKKADWQWYTLIYDKAREFSRDFKVDLSKPEFTSERTDKKDLREKMLKMTYSEWKKMGYSKGSLWYMKHNLDKGSFKLYGRSLDKLK